VDIIDGLEEARLIYLGVQHLQPSDERRLVVDIGGRSTELVLGQGPRILASQSLVLGSVSATQRFFADGVLSAERFAQATASSSGPLQSVAQAWQGAQWDVALGASGTVNAVSQFLRDRGLSDGRISAEHLSGLIAQVQSAGHMDHLQLPELRPDRKKALPGGLSLLSSVFTAFNLSAIAPAKGALRQGVIVDLAQRAAGTR
jgi:exopolyphosphatase/guanosine-5'-triphosphate,3'-diphosphate pyrophosphatase